MQQLLKHLFILLVLCGCCGGAAAEFPAAEFAKLSSDKFTVREEGYSALKQWAEKNSAHSPEKLLKRWQQEQHPEVKARCRNLIKNAYVSRLMGRRPGFIGVGIQDVFLPENNGEAARLAVSINNVNANMAGEKAGLIVGDAVIKLDEIDFSKLDVEHLGKPQPNQFQPRTRLATDIFIDHVKSKSAGDTITLIISRNGKIISKEVTLIERPLHLDGGLEKRKLEYEEVFEKWFLEQQ
ncbi:MAG: hypothetical protein ACSHX0_13675 [Akkermansiaceae bacterium]